MNCCLRILYSLLVISVSVSSVIGQAKVSESNKIGNLSDQTSGLDSLAKSFSLHTQLAREYENVDIDSAISYAKGALDIAEETNDSSAVFNACIQIGDLYVKRGYLQTATIFFNQASEMIHSATARKEHATLSIRLGMINQDEGSYFEALNHFLEALSASEDIDERPLVNLALSHIAELHKNLGNLNKSMEISRRALKGTKSPPIT